MTSRKRCLRTAAAPTSSSGSRPALSRSLPVFAEEAFATLSHGLAPITESRVNLEQAVVLPEEVPADGPGSEESGEEYDQLRVSTKRRRLLERSSGTLRQAPGGRGWQISSLEENAVTPKVMEQYRKLVVDALCHSEEKGLTMNSPEEVDAALVCRLTTMFLEGLDSALGMKLVAGWAALFPAFGKGGRHPLVRCHRAMKGWRRLVPPRSRVGVVFYVIAGIAAMLVEMGFWWMAFWVLLGHGGYLRPSSIMRIRGRDFVPPVSGVSECWGLLLHPSSRGEISKTGSQDDAVLWDVPELKFLEPVFAQLRSRRPDQPIFDFTYAQLAKRVQEAAAVLQVKFVPYQVRHSGPSWDRLRQRRSLLEIQKRGHWRTFSSVQRYEKSTRSMSQYHELRPELRSHLEALAARLPHIMMHGERLPPCPNIGVTRRAVRGEAPAKPAVAKKRRLR